MTYVWRIEVAMNAGDFFENWFKKIAAPLRTGPLCSVGQLRCKLSML